nr:hypothetical protein [Tanacetum cinerariifolium]
MGGDGGEDGVGGVGFVVVLWQWYGEMRRQRWCSGDVAATEMKMVVRMMVTKMEADPSGVVVFASDAGGGGRKPAEAALDLL